MFMRTLVISQMDRKTNFKPYIFSTWHNRSLDPDHPVQQCSEHQYTQNEIPKKKLVLQASGFTAELKIVGLTK